MTYDLMSPPDGGALAVGAEFSPTGLALPDHLTFDDWVQAGNTVANIAGGVNWWIGDWLNAGERFGERYAQHVDVLGLDPGTLSNIASVAGRIEKPRRRGNLSFSHHQAVAYLPPEQQDDLLDKAEANGWTRSDLREAVAAVKALPAAKQELGTVSAGPTSTAPGPVAPEGETKDPSEQTEDDHQPELGADLVAELEEADKTIRAQQAELESLRTSEAGGEIAKLHERIARLEGLVQQRANESLEKERLIKFYRRIVDEARQALGVESNGEIVGAIRELIR